MLQKIKNLAAVTPSENYDGTTYAIDVRTTIVIAFDKESIPMNTDINPTLYSKIVGVFKNIKSVTNPVKLSAKDIPSYEAPLPGEPNRFVMSVKGHPIDKSHALILKWLLKNRSSKSVKLFVGSYNDTKVLVVRSKKFKFMSVLFTNAKSSDLITHSTFNWYSPIKIKLPEKYVLRPCKRTKDSDGVLRYEYPELGIAIVKNLHSYNVIHMESGIKLHYSDGPKKLHTAKQLIEIFAFSRVPWKSDVDSLNEYLENNKELNKHLFDIVDFFIKDRYDFDKIMKLLLSDSKTLYHDLTELYK